MKKIIALAVVLAILSCLLLSGCNAYDAQEPDGGDDISTEAAIPSDEAEDGSGRAETSTVADDTMSEVTVSVDLDDKTFEVSGDVNHSSDTSASEDNTTKAPADGDESKDSEADSNPSSDISDDDSDESGSGLKYAENADTVTLEVTPAKADLAQDDFTIVFRNSENTVFDYGVEYRLEYYDGEWKEIDFVNGYEFYEVLYTGGDGSELKFSLKNHDFERKAGRYRVSQLILGERIYAEFELIG